MNTVAFVVGGLGLAYGAWSRYYLWRWAQECRGTRISIAFKRKVKIDAPFTEYLLWARQARKDKAAAGPARMIYSANGTSVMIVQRPRLKTKLALMWANRKKNTDAESPSQVPEPSNG